VEALDAEKLKALELFGELFGELFEDKVHCKEECNGCV
jgi:hypothetical protein